MNPLGTSSQVTPISSIQRWIDTPSPVYDIMVDDESKRRISPFKWSDSINNKVALWPGDITELGVEAIIHSTNEAMNDKGNILSQKLIKRAGPDLQQDIKKNLKTCRTGEAKLTPGYKLPARYVIHTVGPRYNIKYRTAAESALYNGYRSVLAVVREYNIKSLGLCCLHSARRGYPSVEGAHIAIRTVRRFLEKFHSGVDLIVLVITPEDADVYNSLLPLYFPRSQCEEDFAAYHLPMDIGNEDGEPIIPERQIRIASNPTHDLPKNADSSESPDGLDESVSISEAFETSVAVGAHSFAKMESDFDKQRKSKLHTTFSGENLNDHSRSERYARWLKRARQADHSSMAALRCLYQSGFDKHGRSVVVFLAKNFPAACVPREKAMLYFLSVLDNIVDSPYVFVYFLTRTDQDNHPDMSFIKDIYSLVDARYFLNLGALYIVHPTIWSKMLTWWLTTFSLSALKPKVYNIPGLEYLYSRIAPDQLDVPSFVLDHDMRVHGTRYYDPDQDEAIGAL